MSTDHIYLWVWESSQQRRKIRKSRERENRTNLIIHIFLWLEVGREEEGSRTTNPIEA